MSTLRPRRTTISGARAQFAGIVADVMNASPTGALVRTAHQQPPGEQGPLLLETDETSIPLTARVVRCEPLAGPLGTSKGQFALALTFVNPSAEAQARLAQVCKVGRRAESAARRLKVSLARRCPACKSRNVARESPHRYSCCACGLVFTGMRVGFLRIAR
jgi:hypothetical protein